MEQGARFEAKGEYEMALGEYRSVLAEDPKNSEAYFAAAEVRMKMKDLAGALANYRLAYKFQPTMSAAYEGAAKVYEAMGQKTKADAERAKDPKNKPAEEVVAEPVAETPAAPEPVAKAEEPAKPVEQPKAAETPKAQEPAKAAEPVKAAEAPKKEEPAKAAEAPSAASSNPFERGKALLAEGKYKEAAPVWREILAKKPGDAGAYFYAGVTRFEMGEYDKAEFNLKKGISFKERGNDANYYLAQVYQKTNRTELEKKSLAAYLKKAAPDGMFRKAAEARFAELTAAPVDTAKAESVAAAEPAAEPAAPVETKPAPAAAPAKKNSSIVDANMLFKAGNYESALQMYKALLETEVTEDERYFAMLQMGNIYRELRDFHSAVSRYREVVQQYPESDWATEAERALEDAVWLEKHASELPRRTR